MDRETSAPGFRADRWASQGRRLIHVPIIHTQADMGALSEPIARLKMKKLGRRGWERNLNLVNRLWTQIEEAIQKLALPYKRVRLYQDGLPDCGHEVEIVAELATAGSRNHQLLLQLRDGGATVMGTESSELLVEEYQIVKGVFAPGTGKLRTQEESRRTALRDSLLARRDQYIARRINNSLLSGEIGLLFLGMLHFVDPWLDKDIRLTRLIQNPQA